MTAVRTAVASTCMTRRRIRTTRFVPLLNSENRLCVVAALPGMRKVAHENVDIVYL
jgi:hypothetical protein